MNQTIFIICAIFGFFLAQIPVSHQFFNFFDKLLFSNKCIEDLGCFYTGPPFYHLTNRPISLSPDVPKAKFYLYTPSNPEEKYVLNITLESLKKSSFDSKLPTIIYIHGFVALKPNFDDAQIRTDIREALLKQGNYNVIIVDWTMNNKFPYAQAVANSRSTGAKLAKLIKFLMKNAGVKAENFHLIGHSLGAHIAGYAGERISNLGRITGLDPAGPYFHQVGPEVRLDPSDAMYVDAIHTGGSNSVFKGFGTNEALGHIDFYPDGGKKQSACSYSNNTLGKIIDATTSLLPSGCDHWSANVYFLESIDNTQCKFLAVQCASYEQFEDGQCPAEKFPVAEMGFHSTPIKNLDLPAKFYLKTNPSPPYCFQESINL